MTKKNVSEREFPVFPHCECSVEKREILSHKKKISSNQLFSNFFSKTIVFTKFLWKMCEREFLQFQHCDFENFWSIVHTVFLEGRIWEDIFHTCILMISKSMLPQSSIWWTSVWTIFALVTIDQWISWTFGKPDMDFPMKSADVFPQCWFWRGYITSVTVFTD